jgi:hypothetical protein
MWQSWTPAVLLMPYGHWGRNGVLSSCRLVDGSPKQCDEAA